MLTKIDMLIYNLVAFAALVTVIVFQVQEATAYVDVFGNLFK
jgi:hypothetical protein